MGSIGSTLYVALLRAHELERQRKKEQAQYDDQRYDKSMEQLNATHALSETAKNSEFERKLKMAQMLGQSAGKTGREKPVGLGNSAAQEWSNAAYVGGEATRELDSQKRAMEDERWARRYATGLSNNPYNDPSEEVDRIAIDTMNKSIPGANVRGPLVNRMTPPARASAGGGRNQLSPTVKLVAQLHREPIFKNAQDVKTAYDRLTLAPDDRMGDASIVYGYAKIMDPTTGVRDGERADVSNAASWPEQIRVLYNNALDGKRLPPRQRQEIIGSAKTTFAAFRNRYDRLVTQYRALAENDLLDPDLVVADYGFSDQTSQPAPARQTGVSMPQPQQATQLDDEFDQFSGMK